MLLVVLLCGVVGCVGSYDFALCVVRVVEVLCDG